MIRYKKTCVFVYRGSKSNINITTYLKKFNRAKENTDKTADVYLYIYTQDANVEQQVRLNIDNAGWLLRHGHIIFTFQFSFCFVAFITSFQLFIIGIEHNQCLH